MSFDEYLLGQLTRIQSLQLLAMGRGLARVSKEQQGFVCVRIGWVYVKNGLEMLF